MSVPSLSSAVRPSTSVRGDLQEQGRAGQPPGLGLCATSVGLPCLRQKAWVLRGDLRAHLMGSAGRAGGESDLRRPLGFPGTPLTPRPEQMEGDRLLSMRGVEQGQETMGRVGEGGLDGAGTGVQPPWRSGFLSGAHPGHPQGFLVRG